MTRRCHIHSPSGTSAEKYFALFSGVRNKKKKDLENNKRDEERERALGAGRKKNGSVAKGKKNRWVRKIPKKRNLGRTGSQR